MKPHSQNILKAIKLPSKAIETWINHEELPSLPVGLRPFFGQVFAFLLMVPAVEGAKNGEAASFFLPSMFWDSTYWIILGRDGGWDGMVEVYHGKMDVENPWRFHGITIIFIGKWNYHHFLFGKTIELLVI